MEAYLAIFITMLISTSACVIEKTHGPGILRDLAYFLCIPPIILPGLVNLLAYILSFNSAPWNNPGRYVPQALASNGRTTERTTKWISL
jgi:ABC-type spermidine/putrescine transport system permease subunit II